jgi:transcriptional regulator with XRE-family HTH domain
MDERPKHPLATTRKARGLTQEQLAERARTDQSVISRIENGSIVPGARLVHRLMRALEASFEQVVDTDALERDALDESGKAA